MPPLHCKRNDLPTQGRYSKRRIAGQASSWGVQTIHPSIIHPTNGNSLCSSFDLVEFAKVVSRLLLSFDLVGGRGRKRVRRGCERERERVRENDSTAVVERGDRSQGVERINILYFFSKKKASRSESIGLVFWGEETSGFIHSIQVILLQTTIPQVNSIFTVCFMSKVRQYISMIRRAA